MGDHYLKSAFLENVRTIVGEPERSRTTRGSHALTSILGRNHVTHDSRLPLKESLP